MKSLHIITPVKDSIEFTLETIKAILNSEIKVPYTYTVYNDFSTEENTKILEYKNFVLIQLIGVLQLYLVHSFYYGCMVF